MSTTADTQARIDELRTRYEAELALAEAATPGEWMVTVDDRNKHLGGTGLCHQIVVNEYVPPADGQGLGENIYTLVCDLAPEYMTDAEIDRALNYRSPNLRFFMSARTTAPRDARSHLAILGLIQSHVLPEPSPELAATFHKSLTQKREAQRPIHDLALALLDALEGAGGQG